MVTVVDNLTAAIFTFTQKLHLIELVIWETLSVSVSLLA